MGSTSLVEAMQEVGPSIFFSLLVITVSFMPIFMLEGTEGRLFKPLAFTNVFSIGFSAILAVTLIPALAALLIRGNITKEEKNPLNRLLIAIYIPIVRLILLAVPFSLVGAIWLLYFLNYNMSVAVWVGLIALAGFRCPNWGDYVAISQAFLSEISS